MNLDYHYNLKSEIENISPTLLEVNKDVLDTRWEGKNLQSLSYKVHYVIRGECKVYICEKEIQLKTGDVLLVPRDEPMHYVKNSVHNLERYWCSFDLGISRPIFHFDASCISCRVDNQKISAVFENLIKHQKSDCIENILMQKICLLELLNILIYSLNISKKQILNDNSFCKKVNQYIENHFMERISIKDLAAYTHFQESYFSELFQKFFYQTPNKYINNYRLSYSASLLIGDNKLTVSQISIQSGFNDPRYFSRVFKNKYGMTPSQYRYYWNKNT